MKKKVSIETQDLIEKMVKAVKDWEDVLGRACEETYRERAFATLCTLYHLIPFDRGNQWRKTSAEVMSAVRGRVSEYARAEFALYLSEAAIEEDRNDTRDALFNQNYRREAHA